MAWFGAVLTESGRVLPEFGEMGPEYFDQILGASFVVSKGYLTVIDAVVLGLDYGFDSFYGFGQPLVAV